MEDESLISDVLVLVLARDNYYLINQYYNICIMYHAWPDFSTIFFLIREVVQQ